MAFRGVCTSWRAASPKDVFVSFSKVPLLMLAEKEGTNEREFYSLAKRKICTRIPLPDAMGKMFNDVGFGWVLEKASSGEVCLMKPFSSAIIKLPNFKEFPDYYKLKCNPKVLFIRRAFLTANPSETLQFTLGVDGHSYVGFWNNGDKNWTKMETLKSSVLTCCKGKVYIMDLNRKLFVCYSKDVSRSNVEVFPIKNGPHFRTDAWKNYLVKSSDGNQLLLIKRNNHAAEAYIDIGANHFGVFKVDLVRGELVGIDGLGKDAVFLGDNAAVCVDATEFPGILKPNCIYFTDDSHPTYIHSLKCPKGGGKDMGI